MNKEKIIFFLDKNALAPSLLTAVEQALFHIKDFDFAVKKDKTLDFKIELVDISIFEKSKGSGKIRKVVHHRIETKKR